MATTTNYGWTTPDNTAYVKDGASAIRTLGSSIDTTSATTNAAGLVLVKTQTVGSGVASIVVNSAFSATYDSYVISFSGGTGSGGASLYLSLNGITTGYHAQYIYQNVGTATVLGAASGSQSSYQYAGSFNANGSAFTVTVENPFRGQAKKFYNILGELTVGASMGSASGLNVSTTSATGFTITTSSGTVTGGVVAVYGYRKAI